MGGPLSTQGCVIALKEPCASREDLQDAQSTIAVRSRAATPYGLGLESPRVAAAIRAPIWSVESTTWPSMCSGPAPGRTAVAIWLAAVWAMAMAVFSAVLRP